MSGTNARASNKCHQSLAFFPSEMGRNSMMEGKETLYRRKNERLSKEARVDK